jgi:hypothetical protein
MNRETKTRKKDGSQRQWRKRIIGYIESNNNGVSTSMAIAKHTERSISLERRSNKDSTSSMVKKSLDNYGFHKKPAKFVREQFY